MPGLYPGATDAVVRKGGGRGVGPRLCPRHHRAPRGGLFALGVARSSEIVGVAIVGRPVNRNLDDGWTAEVTRVAVVEDVPNGCSKLYGACWRTARNMGYRRILTYTLDVEPGTSLIAAGWKCIAKVEPRSWHRESRPRVDVQPLQVKFRWEISIANQGPLQAPEACTSSLAEA